MKKRKRRGTILLLLFVTVTGLLFFKDFNRKIPQDAFVFSERESSASSAKDGTSTPDSDMALPSEEAQSETGNGEVCVYVCGHVKEPGVYSMAPGDRIFEAIEAAGGVLEDSEPEQLNLAASIHDGEKIYVPAKGEEISESSGAVVDGSSDAVSAGTDAMVNINSADEKALMSLPGIGQARAAEIVAYRDQNGGFSDCDDLMNVPGIGKGIYSKLEGRITVK